MPPTRPPKKVNLATLAAGVSQADGCFAALAAPRQSARGAASVAFLAKACIDAAMRWQS